MGLEATKTKFCLAELEILPGLKVYIDGNSKVSRTNGSYEEPSPNCFSLPHVSTCPGATDDCMAVCYVYGLKQNASEVYDKYVLNERALHQIFSSGDDAFIEAAENLAKWIRTNATGGFRWHVSGDVFSEKHISFIREVCYCAPEVPFWLYTRSLSLISHFWECDMGLIEHNNLVINISADASNWREALEMHKKTGFRLCYMTRDDSLPNLPLGSVIFPDYSLRGRDLEEPTTAEWWQGLSSDQKKMVCPADFFGQSEQHRCGPCKKCLDHWKS